MFVSEIATIFAVSFLNFKNKTVIELRTYQFKAGANGWREAPPILIGRITHEQATVIAYACAKLFNREARYADVTNYEDLAKRNDAGECLGNGYYVDANNMYSYFAYLNNK